MRGFFVSVYLVERGSGARLRIAFSGFRAAIVTVVFLRGRDGVNRLLTNCCGLASDRFYGSACLAKKVAEETLCDLGVNWDFATHL